MCKPVLWRTLETNSTECEKGFAGDESLSHRAQESHWDRTDTRMRGSREARYASCPTPRYTGTVALLFQDGWRWQWRWQWPEGSVAGVERLRGCWALWRRDYTCQTIGAKGSQLEDRPAGMGDAEERES